jgi:hypothetical protein
MKTVVIIWAVLSLACILEACFFTELDSESKEFLKNREKNRKNGNKSTS